MSTPQYKDDAGNAIVPCMLNGQPLVQPSTANFPITCSREQKTIHYGQTATVETVAQVAEAAWDGFRTYKKTSAPERVQWLFKAADIFERRRSEIAARQMAETSCPEFWADFNVSSTVECLRDIAMDVKPALMGELPKKADGSPYHVSKEPVGPVVIIVPWNGAVILGARGVAAALAAGCSVIVKASELCPWTHAAIIEVFVEAGFPPGSIHMLMADRPSGAQVTEALIAHKAIRMIEFIGSAAVGRIIAGVAAKHLKPVVMELGDQSPAIIFDDADLELAAQNVHRNSLALHGQVCFSTERIIVHSSVKNKFCDILASLYKNANMAGYAVSNASAEKGKALVDDAVKHGAKLYFGNNELIGPASLSPSILTDVSAEASIHKNESFAPVVVVTTFETDEEAIAEANSRDGGLSAVIFTTKLERGFRVADELEFGSVCINKVSVEISGPMTGWKESGWGSNCGKYGISSFMQYKTVSF